MRNHLRRAASRLAILGAAVAFSSPAWAQAHAAGPDDHSIPREERMPARATGTFEVTTTPLPFTVEETDGTRLARMALDKRFAGDLQGTGRGEMLTAITAVSGSAAYVAIERVEGTLDGRAGTFVLRHAGTMDRGAQSLSVEVVPDSGTGALEGLTGSMAIHVGEDGHSYVFEYALPEGP